MVKTPPLAKAAFTKVAVLILRSTEGFLNPIQRAHRIQRVMH